MRGKIKYYNPMAGYQICSDSVGRLLTNNILNLQYIVYLFG